jgi:uncharacterized protein (DUF2252 family)
MTPPAARSRGRALRREVPRSAHAEWAAPARRRDPVAVLRAQDRSRIAELLPLRHERMAESAFAFFRGSAAVMAADLAATPACGLRVQACGDAHLLNFGVFATAERRLVFDVDDLDETLPAPFEWDVKRLAVSAVLTARHRGFSSRHAAAAATAAVARYRERVLALAAMRGLDAWYAGLTVDEIAAASRARSAAALERKVVRDASRHTNLGALKRMTKIVDGEPRITDRPPLIEHLAGGHAQVQRCFARYAESVPDELRVLLGRYRLVDSARRVGGIGSVGNDTRVLLLIGERADDPLFLQLKQARRSVLEPFAGRSAYGHAGERVVRGQRLVQAGGDPFLGWTSGGRRQYFVRQLRDMKAKADIEGATPRALADYAGLCGLTLAHAHARSGDAGAIAGYLGSGDAFDRAVAGFAEDYAGQAEADHAAFASAVGAA